MARSKGTTISVRIPVDWDSMTTRKRQRLRQIVGRDTRVICAYLGVIEQHEAELLTGRSKNRVNECELDKLTLTAIQVIGDREKRESVPHDFKKRFPRISPTEFTECRQTATAAYESYLTLRNKGRKAARPNKASGGKRMPRWVFIPYRARLIEHKTKVARWWLDLRDSLDSTSSEGRRHDRLLIPLKVSPFHLNQLARGEAKALQVFRDFANKWWISVAIRLPSSEDCCDSSLQFAVLGIDLGIKKAVCTTLLTEKRISETRYFSQPDKIRRLERLDELVSSLQREVSIRRNGGEEPYGLLGKLKSLKRKRRRVSREYDRSLVRRLLDYIAEIGTKYQLYVALGRVAGIRQVARRGRGMSKRIRGMIHRWAFARISDMIQHGLAQLGWPTEGSSSRFLRVPEAWTSIICWKCGKKGSRPKQSLFVCRCGFRTNADRNGSLNIARRLIKLIPSLTNETGLGHWARPERAAVPKAGRKRSSKQKPLLPSEDDTSHLGESAVVHFARRGPLSDGDRTELCDDDQAVASTVETLSDSVRDVNGPCQEKEVRTDGGVVS